MLRSALSRLTDPTAIGSAASFPAARTRTRRVRAPECRSTRASIHDYLNGRLRPTRRNAVEGHIDSCGECTRAFTDVREVFWTRRRLNQRLAAAGHPGGRHRRILHGNAIIQETTGRGPDVLDGEY